MPKRRKTRKQKINAQSRHQVNKPVITVTENTPITQQPSAPVKPKDKIAINTSGYGYLYADLRKTVILTFLIIISELILAKIIF